MTRILKTLVALIVTYIFVLLYHYTTDDWRDGMIGAIVFWMVMGRR